MAYLFWIVVGIFIAYLLPVAWHQKFKDWFFSWLSKRAKTKPVVKKAEVIEGESPKKKIEKEDEIIEL